MENVPTVEGVPTCPKCGGTSFVPRRKTSTKVAFGVLSAAGRPHHVECVTCGQLYERPNVGRSSTVPDLKPSPSFPQPVASVGTQAERHTTRSCPWCAEPIRLQAVVCRFCGREVEAIPAAAENLLVRPDELTQLQARHGETLALVLDELAPYASEEGVRITADLIDELCQSVSEGWSHEVSLSELFAPPFEVLPFVSLQSFRERKVLTGPEREQKIDEIRQQARSSRMLAWGLLLPLADAPVEELMGAIDALPSEDKLRALLDRGKRP